MGHWLLIVPAPRKQTFGGDWLGGEVVEVREGVPEINPFTGKRDVLDFAVMYSGGLAQVDVDDIKNFGSKRIDKDLLKTRLSAEDAAKVDLIFDNARANPDNEIPRVDGQAVKVSVVPKGGA